MSASEARSGWCVYGASEEERAQRGPLEESDSVAPATKRLATPGNVVVEELIV